MTTKTRVEYRIAPGAHISKDQAEPLLAVIRKKFKGKRPTPELLIEEAEKKTSPIHHLFDWDKGRAATAHWRERALYYLRSIDVVEVDIETHKVIRGPVRFAMPDTIDVHHGEINYVPAQRADGQPVDVAMENARLDLHAWVSRYSRYVEFFGLFDKVISEIEKLSKKLDDNPPKKKRKRG